MADQDIDEDMHSHSTGRDSADMDEDGEATSQHVDTDEAEENEPVVQLNGEEDSDDEADEDVSSELEDECSEFGYGDLEEQVIEDDDNDDKDESDNDSEIDLGAEDGEGAADNEEDYDDYGEPVAMSRSLHQAYGTCRGLNWGKIRSSNLQLTHSINLDSTGAGVVPFSDQSTIIQSSPTAYSVYLTPKKIFKTIFAVVSKFCAMNQSGLPTPPPSTPTTNPAQSSSSAPSQSASDVSLASIVATITSATSSPSHLNQYLRNCASKDVREVLLASILPGSQDPLTLLNARDHTLGMLYILSARLHSVASDKPLWHHIESFCRDFIPEHARVAPDRVTLLATGIRQLADVEGNPKLAIAPLSDLLVKYPPTLSHLTTIHPIFVT
ncbi:hypothetical protein EDD22DRAFT_1014793, partial [Suillus occidentalis]